MSNGSDWLPELMIFQGDWNSFVDEVYDRFCVDLVRGQVVYNGLQVSVRRHPESNGKGYGFWHCVSEGDFENERVPDLERCSRIGWIRAIIDNLDDSRVEQWTNKRKSEVSHLLWFQEEYLVVLGERNGYFLLKTAYCTDRSHRKQALRRECDRSKKS